MTEVLRVGLTGDKQLKAYLENAITDAPKELRQALKVVGQAVFDLTQESVPVKRGVLKRSGRFTTLVSSKREEIGIRIVYGGPEAPYAVQVHENLGAHHNNGEAKYVERPIMKKKPELAGELANQIDLRRVGGR